MEDLFFVELAELVKGQPFTGMAAGRFVDMHGREVELGAGDIQTFVDNTNALIASFKERGMPGLPIDARRHDKGDAAGWIISAEAGALADGTPVVNLSAEWTTVGADLLRERVMTNFSPTIDLERKAIRGGSLTNWPATVDARGAPLFAAVELSEGVYGLRHVWQPALSFQESRAMAIEVTNEQLEDMVTARVKAQLAELNQQLPAQLAEALGVQADAQVSNIAELAEVIRKQEQARWQQQLAELQRANEYAELAASLTGGTSAAPRGIPAQADELRDHLLRLSAEEAKYWSDLLGNIQRAGLTEFSEIGHSKRVDQKRELPEEYAVALDAGTLTVADLSNPIIGINPADFDLSKWDK